MTSLNIGPDGLILVWALIVSVVVALLTWRRMSLRSAAITTLIVALALVVWQVRVVEGRSFGVEVITTSFILVPSALLLGASRVRWLSRHAWVLLLVGPIVFVGCFVGICEVCAKAGLLGS
jgi:hypothetical protein